MAVFPAFFGLFMAALVTGQVVDITPKQEVRRVGKDLTVMCKVPYSIDSCRMTVGTTPYRLLPDMKAGDVVYTGNGFRSGECGAHIRNIKEEWNGNITCTLPPESGAIELTASMRLIVARPPQDPIIVSPIEPFFVDGAELRAQCIVPEGRPVASTKWFLDNEEIFTGLHNPVITQEPGTDLETIRQNITLQLSPNEDGKMLVCQADHQAWDTPREAKRQLLVRYPPYALDSEFITIFGLKLGGEGRLNVTVRANPAPQAEWRFGGMTLAARQANELGTIAAMEPVALGGGYYNVTLLISQISKEDVERKYYLKVTNDLGSQEFTVSISTMDEPVGVELDTGAIVGIVIAVLVLLIAVFLVVFAKATDRWCFAGGHRGRDHTKSSGESTPAGDVLLESGMALSPTSDTESAVGGRERSRLAQLSARVRGVLPRAKDKVQSTEPAQPVAEQKPLSDEKKGVVYAELQLGEQTAEKPPPPSTEYAEIVYTDQPKETKE